MKSSLAVASAAALSIFPFVRSSEASEVLWSIGQTDQTSADLALGTKNLSVAYALAFPTDPLFIVGKSMAAPIGQPFSREKTISGAGLSRPGFHLVDFPLPAAQQPTEVKVSLAAGGSISPSPPAEMNPMRKWTVYILVHSHHDLGYTDIQPRVIAKQMRNYDLALADIARCKNFPDGAKYVWNTEALWSLDNYLKHFPQNEPEIIEAIKAGSIYPNAWYANELTGLCRPEELLRLSTFGLRLRQKTGVPIDSAMSSDVPGMSWGSIQALNEAGVRYLSDGPNQSARIGSTVTATEDKPFYWLSPSGNNRVLFWNPWGGYGAQGKIGHLEWADAGKPLLAHLLKLQTGNYPYDICNIRWSGWGDNAQTDAALAPFVKHWNETHAYPHLVIASTSTAFHALEDKYGKEIPTLKGDLSPYWEDGAGSSAHETALNRQAAEQLVQAETLYAILQPQKSPADAFYQAWTNVILYDEHTWGANASIRTPNDPGVQAQWAIKQAFATAASQQSRELMDHAVSGGGSSMADQFDVYNTCNWPRTDVVTLPKKTSDIGDVVKDESGRTLPSQRLSTGELAFLVRDIPPFASRRYRVEAGPAAGGSGLLQAANGQLSNGESTIKIDPASGGITEWRTRDYPDNLIDTSNAKLNDYVYALGNGLDHLSYPAVPKITVKESGPVEASLLVESDAPGTRSLGREVKIYGGLSRVDLIDELDKTDVVEAEAGHVAFPFNLPDGQIRLDSQFAVTRPELDQIPGANKNWFTVSRWADVSTPADGVTVATLDAPLMEVGGITATFARTPNGAWITKLKPTQTLYSWIFNNHWFTNYRASQSGTLTYRYSLQAHHAYNTLEATRFGIERSQPLRVFPAAGKPIAASRLTIQPDNLIVTAFKSSDDGQALIVRFFNPSDAAATTRMNWSDPQPAEFWKSDMSEEPLTKMGPTITVPAWSLLTIRAK